MSYIENARKLKEQIDANKVIIDAVAEAGGIKHTITPSDKVGYDWKNYYVNEILVRQVYVLQAVPVGTESNPYTWTATTVMVPNAYYVHNDERKVWMGKYGITTTWDDEDLILF